MLISARYTETAGVAIDVDTGLNVTIGVEMNPFIQVIDTIDITPPKDNDVIPFSESEISTLLHLNSKVNPLLADIWRYNSNDEFSYS
jgi:hypothetical protein